MNSFKTDSKGVPIPETYNNTNLMTVADGLAMNVDPRLDFSVGRLGIRWKNYAVAPYGMIGRVNLLPMVIIPIKRRWFLQNLHIWSKDFRGAVHHSIFMLSDLPTCCYGRLKR